MLIELQTKSSSGTFFAQLATDLGDALDLAKDARRAPNVVVTIRIGDDTSSFHWRRVGNDNQWERVPPFVCKYCGQPSWHEASDQTAPPDYCHPSDHGDPMEFDTDYERRISC